MLPINQNQALFSLLGTTYGGNGTTTFALPDLRGRIANAFGQGPRPRNRIPSGKPGGEESHTLALSEMAAGGHTHSIRATVNGQTGGGNVPSDAVGLGSGYASETGSPVAEHLQFGRRRRSQWGRLRRLAGSRMRTACRSLD